MGYPEDNFKGAKGKRFGDGQTRKGNGRRPSIYKLTEQFDISATDINNIFKNVAIPYTFGELQDMVSEQKARELPALQVMIISALLQDTKKGSLIALMQILERIHGKPTQKDIIEFSDIPDGAKDRLDMIFGDAQEKSRKIKPKIVSKKSARKKAE